ncbi:hypothetical protein [uncultured Mameliella sp.]|uniref:hypothetical protein n=1 Tax=uncultured Mameliella sp. TaxID=1447087 RepID=UPI002628643D|nr:hypothetical protein [uncultured Mameliella sp.]
MQQTVPMAEEGKAIMAARDGWTGILEEGEEILWQGRPDAGKWLEGKGVGTFLVLGFIFAAFLYTPVTDWLDSGQGVGALMPVMALVGGLVVFLGAGLLSLRWKHRRTWYTLTDRRAFIATVGLIKGRKLRDYWLHPGRKIELHKTEPPSVIFDTRVVQKGDSTQYVETGFKHIAEAEKVHALMKDCQARWNELDV